METYEQLKIEAETQKLRADSYFSLLEDAGKEMQRLTKLCEDLQFANGDLKQRLKDVTSDLNDYRIKNDDLIIKKSELLRSLNNASELQAHTENELNDLKRLINSCRAGEISKKKLAKKLLKLYDNE